MFIIFDWDGTLADSRQHIVTALQQAIGQLGLPEVSDEQCAALIGLGLREAASTLYPQLEADAVDVFCKTYSERFISLGQGEFPLTLFEGARETLERLHDQGYQLGVATGKSRRGLDRALGQAGLGKFFHATRTADETASKPHPKMLLELLEETGFEAQRTIMIGDTSYDLEMAQRAGVPSLGVSYGVHSVDVLQQYAPVGVLDSIGGLLDWLEIGYAGN